MKVFFFTILAVIIVPLIFSFFQRKAYENKLQPAVVSKVTDILSEQGLGHLEMEVDHLDVVVSGSVDADQLDSVKAAKEKIGTIGHGEVRPSAKGFDVKVNGNLKVSKKEDALIFSGHVNDLEGIKGNLGEAVSPLTAQDSPELQLDELYTDSPVLSSAPLKDWSNSYLKLQGDRGFSVSAKDDKVRPFGPITINLKNRITKRAEDAGLDLDASGFQIIDPTPAVFNITNVGGTISLKGKGPAGLKADQFYPGAQGKFAGDHFTELHPSVKSPAFRKWMQGYFKNRGNRGLKIAHDSVTMTGRATPSLQRGWMNQLKELSVKPSSKLVLYPSEYHYPGYKSQSGLSAEATKALSEAFALNQIFFDSGDSSVRKDQLPKITALEKAIKTAGDKVNFIIGGHADATGNVEINRALSKKRAQSVVAALAKKGIAETRFTVSSFGAAKASSGGSSESDRKVEILIK